MITGHKLEKGRIYELIHHYIQNKDEESGRMILEVMMDTTRNTFNYLLSKNFSGISGSGFMLKKEAISAASNACWIAITDENFLNQYEKWKEKNMSIKKSLFSGKNNEQIFLIYLSNLAARTIYRLSKDEFSELYSMFVRKKSIQYLEDLKVQVSDTPLFSSGRHRFASVSGIGDLEETDRLSNILDEENSFIMQAYNMIKNNEYRNVLSDYDIKGISLKQIALDKNLDHSVVRQWHRRGLTELKRNLERIIKGTCSDYYDMAVREIRITYSTLDEPYRLRLRLIELSNEGLSTNESLDRLIADGYFPELDNMSIVSDFEALESVLSSIRGFPYMDERLLADDHFRDSLYNELKSGNTKEHNVRYVLLQILKFQLQQALWALYETFKEIAEMSPREGKNRKPRKEDGWEEKEECIV